MKCDSLCVGPDPSSFGAVDVLGYFILDVTEDVISSFGLLFANLSTNFDQEGIFLRLLADANS